MSPPASEFQTRKKPDSIEPGFLIFLGNKDSNLESPDPETGALPFGHSPIRLSILLNAEDKAKAPTRLELV